MSAPIPQARRAHPSRSARTERRCTCHASPHRAYLAAMIRMPSRGVVLVAVVAPHVDELATHGRRCEANGSRSGGNDKNLVHDANLPICTGADRDERGRTVTRRSVRQANRAGCTCNNQPSAVPFGSDRRNGWRSDATSVRVAAKLPCFVAPGAGHPNSPGPTVTCQSGRAAIKTERLRIRRR
jgi:hypothetical protein